MYIENHPILGKAEDANIVSIYVDGREVRVREGEMVAAELLAHGIRVNRYTLKKHEARGVFCGIGQCTDCVMVVNGKRNTRTCITPAVDGMVIETQDKFKG